MPISTFLSQYVCTFLIRLYWGRVIVQSKRLNRQECLKKWPKKLICVKLKSYVQTCFLTGIELIWHMYGPASSKVAPEMCNRNLLRVESCETDILWLLLITCFPMAWMALVSALIQPTWNKIKQYQKLILYSDYIWILGPDHVQVNCRLKVHWKDFLQKKITIHFT